MENFRKLGIIEPIIKIIEEEKFEKPSEIQAKAIPFVVQGKDVIGGSATGSGKTLVFGAGIIKNVEHGKGVQSLILTPTRELAEQVARTLRKFSKYKRLEIIAVYGGLSINPQIEKLREADVVVATPGRIMDHMERRTIDLKRVKILVLDEADRMLDMGFIDDVEKIIRACPKERQTLLFSATIYSDIANIAQKYMKDPIKVSVESYVDPSKLKQIFYDVADGFKFALLVHLLKYEKAGLVMVFCNTRKNVDFVAKSLAMNQVDALAVHGGLSQEKRSHVMRKFNSKDVYVLVCTDVAARGLDIKGVSHIYNYDMPKNSKDYIHRIGRTARAGKEGIAINILGRRDYENFSKVQEDRSLNIVKEQVPETAKVRIHRPGQGFEHGEGQRPWSHHNRSEQDQGHNRNYGHDNRHRSEGQNRYGRGDGGNRRFGRHSRRN